MGIGAIGTRTNGSFGVTKENLKPPSNRKKQLAAGEYNRLADAVIELQGAVGTTTSPTAGSAEYRLNKLEGDSLTITPAGGSTTDDLDAGTARLVFVEGTGNVSITGLISTRKDVTIINAKSSGTLTIKNNDSGSAAGNRFTPASGADVTISSKSAAKFYKATTLNAWLGG